MRAVRGAGIVLTLSNVVGQKGPRPNWTVLSPTRFMFENNMEFVWNGLLDMHVLLNTLKSDEEMTSKKPSPLLASGGGRAPPSP
jgi:hypothetical protein